MINIFSLLGACAMSVFSASASFQKENPKLASGNPVYTQTVDGGWECVYYDSGDTRYYFTLDNTSLNDWKATVVDRSIQNCFVSFVYYDTGSSTFRGFYHANYGNGTRLTYNQAIKLVYDNVSQGQAVVNGVFMYFSYYSSYIRMYLNYGTGYLGGGSYTFANSEWHSREYLEFNIYEEIFTGTYGFSTFSTATGLQIGTKTLKDIDSENYSLMPYDRDIIHDTQTVPFVSATGCIYSRNLTDNEFTDITYYSHMIEFSKWKVSDYNNGYDQGLQEGYGTGYQDGYYAGYQEADNQDTTALTIFTGIINIALLPVNVFLKILNFEVFGINIGGLVSAFLTIAIVIILWRIISGSKND